MKVDDRVHLDGTVSIVTGASRGIGRAVALALAEAGSAVALIARTESGLRETASMIEEAGGEAASWQVDVTDRSQVEAAVADIEQAMGPVCTLVNNAGEGRGNGPLWMSDPDEWWRVLEVNLRGPYLFSRFVLPHMIARGAGRIVNVGSNAGIRPTPFATAYSSSKAALLRLTDSLAESVRGLGVTVFAISPGWVWTAMTERAVVEIKKFDPEFEGIPDSETSPPEAAGALVVSLASGRADALTGRYIHVSDDLERLITEASTIEERDLLTLRLAGIDD